MTAGLTCPPEMLAPTETATNRAKACAIAAATRPAGVAEPSLVSLSVIHIDDLLICAFKRNYDILVP